jgi:integrase
VIKQVEFEKQREGTKFDPEKGKWLGFQADITIAGRRIRSVFATRKKAETYVEEAKFAAKLKRAGAARAIDPPTVRKLFDARLKKIKVHSEKVRCRRIFNLFVSLLPKNAKITDVRPSDFTRFINAREGLKPETINREINPLSKAFSVATELFPDLEDFEPPKIRRPKFKATRRERVVKAEEKDAIVANLYRPREDKESEAKYRNRVRIGRMFEIAWYLGMAYKEVATLKKSKYDGESLHFTRAKTGAHITFEWLPPEVHKILRDAIADSDTEYVFTHSGSTPKNFTYTMRLAVEAAGVDYGRDHGITFHSARHSFVSNAIQHADLKTVASMTGHSDSQMVLLYSHASAQTRRRALESMYGKKDLREIFEKVRSGEMSFEEFERSLR